MTDANHKSGAAPPGFRASFWESRWAPVVAGAVLALAALAAYANTFSVPFLFDDDATIPGNATIRHLWPIWAPLAPPHGLSTSGRPLANLTLAVNYAISGTGVWSYHVVNLVIHVLAGLTLFGVVRRTLRLGSRRAAPASAPKDDASLPIASVVALLWTLHPLQTEAVTYIVQRTESLVSLFFLLTFYGFIRAVEAEKPAGWFLLAIASCLLGMVTKEVMVTAPMLVFLYDRTFVAGSFRAAWQQRRRIYLSLAATWIPLALLVASLGGNRDGTSGLDATVAWWSYWPTQFEAVVHYAWLSVWPHPLIFEYGPFWFHRVAEAAPYALAAALMAGATLFALWRYPETGFLGACFFSILAPTSLMPNTRQMIVEHRMYLPLAALIVLAVAALHRWLGRGFLAASLLVAAAFGWLTFERNRDYGSELALWADTVAKRPDNALAQYNYGFVLLKLGRVAEAIPHYEEAVRLHPDGAEDRNNLGVALARAGRYEEAMAQYREALRLVPDHAEACYNLGLALRNLGRNQEAVPWFERAVRYRPGFADALNLLGVSLSEAGQPSDAIARFEQALQAEPDFFDALNNLGAADLKLDRIQDAVARFRQALALRSDLPAIHTNLGIALFRSGQPDAAIQQFQQSLQLNPDDPDVHLKLAAVLRRAGRTDDANAQEKESLQLQSRRP